MSEHVVSFNHPEKVTITHWGFADEVVTHVAEDGSITVYGLRPLPTNLGESEGA